MRLQILWELWSKQKITGVLAKLEKDTTHVNSFPNSSCSIVDGLAFVWKLKCVGLTFDKAADEIFNARLSFANRSTRIDIVYIVFNIYKYDLIKSFERNGRCSDTLSFKKIVGTNVIRHWNSFLADNNNKNSVDHFLVNSWKKYTKPVNKVIYANIGAQACSQEEGDKGGPSSPRI